MESQYRIIALPDGRQEDRKGGGGNAPTGGNNGGGGNVPTGGNSGNGSIQSSGYGPAPKQGPPGSTYTQYTSDGKNTVKSQTTYGEYGAPEQRIDYQGRDHGVGVPHVHKFSWALRGENVCRIKPVEIYPYRM